MPPSPRRRESPAGKYHQFLWTVSQPFQLVRLRNCAVRREAETAFDPSQIQGQFRALHRCSYPEG